MAVADLREDLNDFQFYIACSRVKSASRFVVLAHESQITNMIYKEVLK